MTLWKGLYPLLYFSDMFDRDEFDSLVELLDDRDNVVSECVRNRLRQYGPDVVRELMTLSFRQKDDSLKEMIRDTAADINSENQLRKLEELSGQGGGRLSLFEAGFIVSSIMDPSLQRDTFEDLFLRCSSEYVAESSDQRTAVENIRIFNHIFFHRLHFAIYDVEMSELKYALISDALRTRQGNPFTVAYIYVMAAKFAGLPLEILTFPGGFVPIYVENGKELFYINVYRNGEVFLKDRLTEFVSALGLNMDVTSFKVRDDNALLTIYLESLQYICSNAGEERKSLALGQALDILGSERFLSIDEEA